MSTRNCFSKTSIYRRRTGSCAHACRPDCAYPLRKGPPWLKSANDSAANSWPTSPAKPDSILAWYRKLIAQKFDGSKHRRYPGRPRIEPKLEALIVQMAKENSGWGYDRIVGALANLGYRVSDETVGNVLRRHGMAPAPKRSPTTTWKEFIRAHLAVLAGIGSLPVTATITAQAKSSVWADRSLRASRYRTATSLWM